MDNIIKAISRFFKSKNFKYGSNSFILIAVVIAIAVVANLLVGTLDLKLDITKNKMFSIGDTTRNVLSKLNKNVEIIGLFDDGKVASGDVYKQVTEMLKQYEKASGKITVRYVDPDKNVGIISQLDPTGTKNIKKSNFVVKAGNKIKVLTDDDLLEKEFDQNTFNVNIIGSNAENSLTGAIKYVAADITPVIYYTEGHMEQDVSKDFTALKKYLENNNYLVKPLNIMLTGKIPKDAEIIMAASPKADFSEDEREAVKNYLKDGGKALFMLDYMDTNQKYPNINNILGQYNLTFNNDKIKETGEGRSYPQDEYTVLLDVTTNAINGDNSNVFMSNARSVSVLTNKKEWIKTTVLIESSSTSRSVNQNGTVSNGPFNIAVASENSGGKALSRVIAMGNSSFISDAAQTKFGQYFNLGAAVITNDFGWLMNKKDETLIAPKKFETPVISITGGQASLFNILLAIVLPLLILGAGMFVWLRRRHL